MYSINFKSKKEVELIFKNEPILSNNGNYFWGYPVHPNINSITKKNIHNHLSEIRGYFFFLGVNHDGIVMANDLLGGYRVYKCEDSQKILFTDDYNVAIEFLKKHSQLKTNLHELYFWDRHGYTTGHGTFIDGVKKIPPGHIIHYSKLLCEDRLYYEVYKNKANALKHVNSCYDDLVKSIQLLKGDNKNKILFFSGGKDSVLLALALKDQRVDFIPVFIKANPIYKEALRDFEKAKRIASEIDINLEVIDVDINERDELQKLLNDSMLFDRHFSLIHFLGMKEVVKKYGNEIVVINGQSSDAVLSYGASENTIGGIVRRALFFSNNTLFKYIVSKVFSWKFKINYRFSLDKNEMIVDFYNQKYYINLREGNEEYHRKYIQDLLSGYVSQISGWDSLMMYLKIFGYLQGPDNQIVINAAKYWDVHCVFMPYATPGFIYNTVRYKSKLKDIFFPKYVISSILKEKFKFRYRSVKTSTVNSNLKGARVLEVEIKELFETYVKRFID